MSDWDPDRYLIYADERARPFWDLVARVPGDRASIVDLGCGPGNLTAGLFRRWPAAEVLGVDSSAPMIASAQALDPHPQLRFRQQDINEWRADPAVDLILSNAALQWIPGHRSLLPGWVDALDAGGVLAFQVPGNFDQPSHRLLYELASDPRFARWTTGLERPASATAEEYVEHLSRAGCIVDAWETTYLHMLPGEDPVFTWISGTGARPILAALPQAERRVFVDEYRAALRQASPRRDYGTVLPFRRIFVVARRD